MQFSRRVTSAVLLCLGIVSLTSAAMYDPIAVAMSTPVEEAMADKAGLLALAKALNNHDAFTSYGKWFNITLGVNYTQTRPCLQNWNFISCDEFGRVKSILLNNNDLSTVNISWSPGMEPGPLRGYIPWGEMKGLTHLQAFYIQGNLISGPAFPTDIDYFKKLRYINVMNNKLTGTIPPRIANLDMVQFQASENALTGSLPPNLGNWVSMTDFRVSGNLLNGTLPPGIRTWKNAEIIDMSGNFFSGTLPPSWGNCTGTKRLFLDVNRLTGPIPPKWSGMKSLEHFKAGSNKLSGPFPSFLTNLKSLSTLEIPNNLFYGPVPSNVWKHGLQLLDITRNFFNGSMPRPSVFNYYSTLKSDFNCFSRWKSPQLARNQQNSSTCTDFYTALYASPSAPVSDAPVAGVVIYEQKKTSSAESPIVFIIIAIAVALCGMAVAGFILYKSKGGGISSKLTRELKKSTREFTLAEMKTATDNWATMVGKGGYGSVYKAVLKDGTIIAVKRLDKVSKQGDAEFVREVELLSRVHHRHLVNLLGFCAERSERALVYEYMALGSLYEHLHGPGAEEYPLSWESRTKIAIHVALGLEYLHYGADPPLIHRDIKSANILLSEEGFAKVADFGLCKEAPLVSEQDGSEHVVPTATAVKGSFGYLDPEYVNTSVLSEKSDVYSYGVVLLELITGHKSIHEWQPLAYWAEEYLSDAEKTPLMVDPKLQNRFELEELYALCDIASSCVKDRSDERPTMRDVAKALVENLSHSLSSFSGSHRDTTSVTSSSLSSKETSSEASTTVSGSISGSSAVSSEFSYQNYSETLDVFGIKSSNSVKPGGNEEKDEDKDGKSNIVMATGLRGDRMPVPVPKKPDSRNDKDGDDMA